MGPTDGRDPVNLAALKAYPIDDVEAWAVNTEHRWAYNRLDIAAAQRTVQYGPMGVPVPDDAFPVIVKPIMNLWGMGRGAVFCEDRAAFDALGYKAGFMWMTAFFGDHVSTDAFVEFGTISWSAQALGVPSAPDRFDAWFLGHQDEDALMLVRKFCRQQLPRYRGPINVETIGDGIIEVHLRLTKDWLDAGAYDDFPGPARPMIGIPLYSHWPANLPDWARVLPDDGDPRRGFCVVRPQ